MTMVRIVAMPEFESALKQLQKKYPSVAQDVNAALEPIRNGDFQGDQISGIGYAVFKLRTRNRDAKRGKSGGYRLIYYLKTSDRVLLLTIYAKTKQSDITNDEIKRIIEKNQKKEFPNTLGES
jgi:mRNA-degrading endonuclease RelE of RelBE toxin-antitoxin system